MQNDRAAFLRSCIFPRVSEIGTTFAATSFYFTVPLQRYSISRRLALLSTPVTQVLDALDVL